MIRTRLSALTSNPRFRRSARILAGLIFFYGFIGFFVLPGIIQSQVEKTIFEKLHRRASIGAVEVNPYTLALTVRDLKVREPKSDELFASFDTLHINLSSESLLRLAPVIRDARLTAPKVRFARLEAHRYNIDDIVDLSASQPPSEERARFSVNNIQVEGGRIDFDDRPAKAVYAVTDIALGIPFISSLPAQVDIFVEPLLRAKVDGAPLEFKGKARPFAEPADAVVDLKLKELDLTRYIEYLPMKPRARVSDAKLDLDLTARFLQGGDGQALLLQGGAVLKSLNIADLAGKPVLRLQELAVNVQEADIFAGRVDLSRVRLDGLQADVSRDAEDRLNVAQLLPPDEPRSTNSAAKPFALLLTLGELSVRGASLRYADEHGAHPMRTAIDKLDLAVRKVSIDTRKHTVAAGEIVSGGADILFNRNLAPADTIARAPDTAQKAEAESEPGYAISVAKAGINNWSVRVEDRGTREPIVTTAAPISLTVEGFSTAHASRARIDMKANINQSGRMAINGTLGMAPLHADLAIDVKGVDILPLQPFVTDKVNLRATSANLSSNGRVQLDAANDGTLRGGFKGEATLGNLATVDKAGNNDFLRWKSLHAGGVDVRFEPLAISVEQVALSDFFARVIIDPTGRINLQDIVRNDAEKAASPKPADAQGQGKGAVPPVTIKQVSLQGGRVRFTDNFIKPNYSASLSQFGGALSGLSSDPNSRADVDLHGEVNGAPLAVGGRINPLRGDLFLDIKANVRGMELAPLSAYSGKYVGYGIEKGKLSFEAGYQVANRKLTAENRLVLEQLTFGDKVDSPDATSLPVHFAVALLSDRDGVIDLNLPIAGSLDDPQFSIGAVIVKIIGNTIKKVVSQPFAMLGALFGGGAELSHMAFEPGRAAVPAAGEEKLRSLSKALADRPGLKLDIGGRTDPEADREGLRHVAVERKVRALKIRDLRAKGVEVESGSVTVGRDEYPGLLLRAYRDEKFAKPRNVLGLPKDLPVEEMEKLMMANADVDEDDLLSLGNQRAQSVKTWLQKNGQVSPDRLFITAAKVGGAKDGGATASRVDFALR